MKKLLLFVPLLLVSIFACAQEYIPINTFEFKPNEKKYTFGDNVRLRSQPNVDSETLLKIPIGQAITILEKDKNTYLYNGLEWNWYKVKYKNKIGYIVGGLLSISTKKSNGDSCLISFKRIKIDEYEYKGVLLIRLLCNGKLIKKEMPFDDLVADVGIKLTAFNNVGISNIKNIFCISIEEVVCGFSEIDYYFFNDGKKIHKAIELHSNGIESREYYQKLIFPNDIYGKKGVIGVEETTYKTEENGETKSSSKISCWLKWQGKEMKCK